MATMKINDKSVELPTGSRFGIRMVRGKKCRDLELLLMDEGKVAALFPEDNTDFCIKINNTSCKLRILLKLTINRQSYQYIIPAGVDIQPIEALTTNGRKLHFISQDNDEGKLLVAQTAAKYELNFNDASEMCCQIKFEIEVEKMPEVVPPPFLNLDKKQRIRIFVQMMDGAKLCLLINRETTIGHINYAIYTKTNILPSKQRLRFDEKTLNDASLTLRECGISSNATLYLYLQLVGGGGGWCAQPVANDSRVGERGVICFGDKSTQTFETCSDFKIDETCEIKPFIIELRTTPKYSPI